MMSFPSAIRRFGEVAQESRAAGPPPSTEARIARLREVLRQLERGEITAHQAAIQLEARA